MSWIEVIQILSVILGITVIAYGVARYVLSEKAKQTELEKKISGLEERNRLLASNVASSTLGYDELKELSSNAQMAIGADLHSISIPFPKNSPTHLKIIISTDPNAERVLGKEFGISDGIGGRVFLSQVPEFVNKARDDPRHYHVVDKAAGTQTGQGAILTIPLIDSGKTRGIVQFMKNPGGVFSDDDLKVALRFSTPITRLLVTLEARPDNDIPFISRVDESYVTVSFTDINDYGAIARNISLHLSVELLNEYYRRMISHGSEYNAVLEEYLGDGVYLSFQHESKAEAATRALKCAMAMQAEYEKLLHEWSTYEYPVSKSNYHNIGVASGKVYEGIVGHPLYRRRKLIGRAVDTAAHLVEEGKKHNGCIVVSDTTQDLVSGSGFHFTKLEVDSRTCFKLQKAS